MLKLSYEKYNITVADDPTYTPDLADNVQAYQHQYVPGGEFGYQFSSRHGICVTEKSRLVASCILLDSGGATAIHEHSAIIHDGSCVIAVGPFVVSLSLPSLQVNLSTKTDDATCFGIYYSDMHECFISQGEMDVARLSTKGEVVWQRGGADIFFGEFALHDESVDVVDFNGRRYRFDFDTGHELTK